MYKLSRDLSRQLTGIIDVKNKYDATTFYAYLYELPACCGIHVLGHFITESYTKKGLEFAISQIKPHVRCLLATHTDEYKHIIDDLKSCGFKEVTLVESNHVPFPNIHLLMLVGNKPSNRNNEFLRVMGEITNHPNRWYT